jgi:membrane protein YdbS with pleckstrin-like domain
MFFGLIVYVLRFGFQAHAAYEVPKRTAVIVSGMLVLAYFFLWLGIVAILAWGFQNFIDQTSFWLFVIFGIVLAVGLYFHLVRFKQRVYEKWLGWQPKEGVMDG